MSPPRLIPKSPAIPRWEDLPKERREELLHILGRMLKGRVENVEQAESNKEVSHDLADSSPRSKITSRHRDRFAIVYVRQSSPHQVAEHRESADLQYQLGQRAVTLGWPEISVLIIDEDQGLSGPIDGQSPGFQRLLAEISLGRVGIVFGREVSRLSRSNKDWHQLLELCALFGVLIGDADGIYDPTDSNDRLLLGLRGMMSEAELHILRNRLHQGKLNKARRGELFTCVPIGYVRSPSGGIALDPDEQVRSVLALIFAQFEALGSVPKVNAYCAAQGIQVGVRIYKGAHKGELKWYPTTRRLLYEILRHPFYAGAYVYGRCPTNVAAKARGGKILRRTAPPKEWICLLKNRVPAYISWEQYERNQRRLQENDRGRGACRSSLSSRATTLLNRRIRCGHCGSCMSVRSTHTSSTAPRYSCDQSHQKNQGPMCQSVSARAVDRLIGSLIFQAMEPASLELSLRAAEQTQQERERLHRHWRQQLERAQYEVDLAQRRYQAVDPHHRLVARELELDWERRLTEHRQIQDVYARFCQEQPRQMSCSEQEQVRSLATDLPALWQANTTTGADRRAVVRQLIERVTINRRGTSEVIEVQVHWRGGSETRHEVYQGLRKMENLKEFDQLVERVKTLRSQGKTAEQIAKDLNGAGYRSARGGLYTGGRVRWLYRKLELKGPAGVAKAEDLPGKDEWWLPDFAEEIKVPAIVVHRWRWSGWIHARQLPGEQGRWIVWADRDEVRRLRRLRKHELRNRGREAPTNCESPRTENKKW